MKWLALSVLLLFAAVGAVTVVDLLTVNIGSRRLVGGTPYYAGWDSPDLMLGGRIVRFPPLLQQDGRRAAILDQDYYFCSPTTGKIIRMPGGYQTDFASIPYAARLLIDRFGNTLEPAGIHDWLYSVGEGSATAEREQLREEADSIFLRALEDNNVGLATRTIMFWAVRLFGGEAYGAPGEWEKRMRKQSGEPFEPPLPRPSVGSVEQTGCEDFDRRLNHLVGCYASQEHLRFPVGTPRRDEAACGPGDGLEVPLSRMR